MAKMFEIKLFPWAFIIEILILVICFAPLVFDSLFSLERYQGKQWSFASSSVTSERVYVALVSSLSISSVLLFEVILDIFTTLEKSFAPRCIRILALFVPYLLLILVPSRTNSDYIPSILYAQQITFNLTFIYSYYQFGSQVWDVKSSTILATGATLNSFINLYSSIYGVTEYLSTAFGLLVTLYFLAKYCQWCLYIYRTYFLSGKLISKEHYFCSVYMACSFVAVVYNATMNYLFSITLQYSVDLLSSRIYSSTILMTLVSILCDRMLKRDLMVAQVKI